MIIYENQQTNSAEARNAFLEAQKMALEGQSPDAIHRTTGCHQGPDKLWRREISDAGAKMTGKKSGRLGDVMDHPALYREAPHLRNVRFKERKDLPVAGLYTPHNNKIQVHDASDLAVAAHEAAHAEQLHGGAMGKFRNALGPYHKNNLEIEAHDVMKRLPRTADQNRATNPDLLEKKKGKDVTASSTYGGQAGGGEGKQRSRSPVAAAACRVKSAR